jgi:hypothetical protein
MGKKALNEAMNSENHPGGTLLSIINTFGYPSFYDYFESQKNIIIFYVVEKSTISHFMGDGKKDYYVYYFQFEVNEGDILSSSLEKTGYKAKALGKYYPYTQEPLGIFLQKYQHSILSETE